MKKTRVLAALYLFLALLLSSFIHCAPTQAQTSAGRPNFTASDCLEVACVDLMNNNITLNTPVRDKAGTLPFSSRLTGNYYVYTDLNNNWQSTGDFNQAGSLRLSVNGGLASPVTYTADRVAGFCDDGTHLTNYFKNWNVVLSDGTTHPFPTADFTDYNYAGTGSCVSASGFTDPSTDDSGFLLVAAANAVPTLYISWANSTQATTYTTGGLHLVGGPATLLQDSHANKITSSTTGGVTTYKDSMNLPVLVTSGTAPANTFTWTDVSAGSPHVSITTSALKLVTAFTCSGKNDLNNTATQAFPTSISYPDGTSLGLAYESTGTLKTSGRLSQITLREGGVIGYAYGGSNGGIDCTYQTPQTLTRTVNGTEVTQYNLSHSIISGSAYQALNEVIDAGGNETDYLFTGFNGTGTTTLYAEVVTAIYRHKGNGINTKLLLETELYDYNNSTVSATPNAGTISQASVSYPITYRTVYRQPANKSNWSATQTHYDGYGDILWVAEYDYGQTVPAVKIAYTYGSCTANCGTTAPTINTTALAGNYIFDLPGEVLTTTGTNYTALSNYTYDTGGLGNLTNVHIWAGGTTVLANSVSNVFNTNGTISKSYDANNNETDYSYLSAGYFDGCTGISQYPFPTQIKDVTTALHSDFTYDCTGGVALTSKDVNSNTVATYGYTYGAGAGVAGTTPDPFWRARTTMDANNNVHFDDFYTNSSVPTFYANGTSSVMQTYTNWDGYGRPKNVQRNDGSGTTFDTVSTSYGWSGIYAAGQYRQVQSSQPCSAAGSLTCTQYHTTLFDALGRFYSEATTGRETVQHTWTQNDDYIELTPTTSGENSKRRVLEYDGLGRLTIGCELDNVIGTGCGIAGYTGIADAYTYSSFVGGTQVQIKRQGTQTRTFQYDALGRLISKVTPEGGTQSYYYDVVPAACSSFSVVRAFAGKMTCSIDNAGIITAYVYDSLGRLTDVGVNTSITYCKRYRYDNSNGVLGTRPTGVTLTNQNGRMVEAATDDCSHFGTAPLLTDEWFAYDKLGNQTDIWESTPHSTQYYHSVGTFWENNAIKTVQLASPSGYTLTYGLEGEGRPSTLTDTTNSKTLVQGVVYNPAGQTKSVYLIGASSDNDQYTYDDTKTGLMQTYTFNVGTSGNSMTGTLTWNLNDTLKTLNVVDQFSAGNNTSCGSSYDDEARLISFDCGTGNWGQNFTYDAYDNLNKSVIISTAHSGSSWTTGYSSSTNHYTCAGCTYDSDGDVTNDGNNTYQWNEYGKMLSTATSGTPTCGTSGQCITYDAFGRMVEASVNSTWKEYWYPQVGQVQMSGTTINVANFPSPGGSKEVITGLATAYNYLHLDWIGNARLGSSRLRTVTADQAYTPYGEIYFTNGSTSAQYDVFAGTSALFDTGVMYDTPNRELSIVGRWLSPDPAGSGWNQYAYPTNPNTYIDPQGTCDLISGGLTQTPNTPQTQQEQATASELGANLSFPFSGHGAVFGALSGFLGSAPQQVLRNAITDTVTQSAGGPTNLYLFSGSAGLFAQVYPTLPANIRNGITSVTYFSPGMATWNAGSLPMLELVPGAPNPAAFFDPSIATNVVVGNSSGDSFVLNSSLMGAEVGAILPCGHDSNCEFGYFHLIHNWLGRSSSGCPDQQVFTRQNPNGQPGTGGGSGGGGAGGPGGASGVSDPRPTDPIEVVTSTIIF